MYVNMLSMNKINYVSENSKYMPQFCLCAVLDLQNVFVLNLYSFIYAWYLKTYLTNFNWK